MASLQARLISTASRAGSRVKLPSVVHKTRNHANARRYIASASEAGSAYRAFLDGAAKAQEKLGLSFTDAQGKMLPMIDILHALKNSYGDMENLSVQKQIKDAFGSSEAIKIISALIDKTDDLKQSQRELSNATTDNVRQMAKAMQGGREFELLGNKLTNLSSVIGGIFAPMALSAAKTIGKITFAMQGWAKEHPTLTKYIGLGALAIGGLVVAAIPLGLAIATLSISFGALSLAISPVALTIGGIVLAIGALGTAGYLLIKNWKGITEHIGSLFDGIGEKISSVTSLISQRGKASFATLQQWAQRTSALMGSGISSFLKAPFGRGFKADKEIAITNKIKDEHKTIKSTQLSKAQSISAALDQLTFKKQNTNTKLNKEIQGLNVQLPQSSHISNNSTRPSSMIKGSSSAPIHKTSNNDIKITINNPTSNIDIEQAIKNVLNDDRGLTKAPFGRDDVD